MAAWRAGAVVTPLLFLVSEEELRHALIESRPVGIVTTVGIRAECHRRSERGWTRGYQARESRVAKVRSARGPVRLVSANQASFAAPECPCATSARWLRPSRRSIVDRADTDLAALLYTSGTPGRRRAFRLRTLACPRPVSAAQLDVRTVSTRSAPVLPLPLAHTYVLLVICAGIHRTDQALIDPDPPVRCRPGWAKLAAGSTGPCSSATHGPARSSRCFASAPAAAPSVPICPHHGGDHHRPVPGSAAGHRRECSGRS